jgi:hypothetical protein
MPIAVHTGPEKPNLRKQITRIHIITNKTNYLDKATPSYKFLLKLTKWNKAKTRTEFQNLLPTHYIAPF